MRTASGERERENLLPRLNPNITIAAAVGAEEGGAGEDEIPPLISTIFCISDD